MLKLTLKKKIIIGSISLVLISIIGFIVFILHGLSNALSDKYHKTYTVNESPRPTFLIAVINQKGELKFIEYQTYQQDQQLPQKNFSLYKDKKIQTIDCGLKIFCTIRKDDNEFIVDKRGLFNEGLTNSYKILANNAIIPISENCSTSNCSIGRNPYP